MSSGGFGAGLADGLPETVKKSSHPEADALPLAEAELTAQAAEAADANISTPIMDSATNKSSFFTISPSVASHPIAMLGTSFASVKERPSSPECVEGSQKSTPRIAPVRYL